MSRSVFGWDLPPGVSMRDIDPPEQPCEMCGEHPDNCICPECPICGSVGDPECYAKHGLKVSAEQVLRRDWTLALEEAEYRAECAYYEEMLAKEAQAK